MEKTGLTLGVQRLQTAACRLLRQVAAGGASGRAAGSRHLPQPEVHLQSIVTAEASRRRGGHRDELCH